MSKKEKKVEEKATEIVDELGKYTDEKVGKLEKKIDKMSDILEKFSKQKVEEGGKGKLYSPDISKSDVEKMDWKEKGFHYIQGVLKNDERKLKLLSTDVDARGGYLVPEEYRLEVMKRSMDASVIRPRAQVIPMQHNTLNLNAEDTKPTVYITTEGASKNTTSATFARTQLSLKKLAAIQPVTDELLEDSGIALMDYLTTQLAEAIAEREDWLFMNGNGTTEPAGIDSYTYTTVDAGGDLGWQDLVSAKFTLPQGYRNNAVWIAHSVRIAQLNNLADDNNRPLLVDIEGGTKQTLLGYPVLEHNNMDQSKMFFGDLGRFVIGEKPGMKFDISNEGVIGGSSLFEQDGTALRVVKRLDSAMPLTEAFVEIENV